MTESNTDNSSSERTYIPVEAYLEGILNDNRIMLSRAITLVESSREDHRQQALDIVEHCLPHSGKSIRIGITGIPGAGKSTFIESLGNLLIERGHRPAVLAIDPSSTKTKGSILGDKTRMETLAANPHAFIRPSPAAGTSGGVARKTRETIYLCEAAGYDIILIETVGVGQSETAVHSMVDFFLLLLLAGTGDLLQGIKRGIMEMADLVAINKQDVTDKIQVESAVQEYRRALDFYPKPDSGWEPLVTTCSALTGDGVDAIWEHVESYVSHTRSNGFFEKKRKEQAKAWMHEAIRELLLDRFYSNPAIKKVVGELESKVLAGEMSSAKAAQRVLEQFNRK